MNKDFNRPAGHSTSEELRPLVTGVWLPIITPFADGAVDLESYGRLLKHYLGHGVHGIIPLGTTGESPTIEDDEAEAIVDTTVRIVDGRVPIYIGVGGNSTAKVLKSLRRLERYPFQGILSVCPYYNRPSETGIRQHFAHIAEATDRKILIYNIPYRTGVNLSNDTVLALSEIANVVGIKDSCANLGQSLDLLRRRPTTFSVMTGEDALYYTMLAHRGSGGILASAHFQPEVFLRVYALMTANDHHAAHQAWSTVQNAVQLFFKEPNPAPLKYWLWRQGLIRSAECRLPLAAISTSLARELDLLSA